MPNIHGLNKAEDKIKNFLKNLIALVKRHPGKTRLFVVVVLFSILIFSIHPAEIFAAFKDARPRYLVYAIVLMIPNLLLQFVKWRFVLSSLEPRPSLKITAISLFGGFFLGASTPGRTGEFARGLLIPGHSKLKTASLTFIDKGFNQLMILLYGMTSAAFLLPWPFSIIPIAIVITVIVIMLNIHRTRPYLERFFHRFTKSESVDNALAAFDSLTWRKSFILFVLTTIFYATFSFQFYCLIRCFSDFSLLSGLQTIPVIYVINTMFPVAIGDFGVKEMAAVHVLEPFGIAGGPAFSATLTQNVITFLTPALIGGIVLLFSNPLKNQGAPASDGHKTLSKD